LPSARRGRFYYRTILLSYYRSNFLIYRSDIHRLFIATLSVMNHLPTDAALPALAALFDWPVITNGFHTWQGLRAEAAEQEQHWQVTQCQHIRYQPGLRCTATYTLRQETPGQPPRQTIGVVDCTPDGLRYRSFIQDHDLPWLAAAVDPIAMAARLATMAVEVTAVRPSLSGWQVTPLRYRAGDRCALHYSHPAADQTPGYFGKLLRRPHPQRVAALSTLVDLADQEPTLPRLPRPLAHWPDLHLSIQPAISGSEFHRVVFDKAQPVVERLQWFCHMGAKVAALHSLPPLALPTRPLTDEWPELLAAQPLIERLLPTLTMPYITTLATLQATASLLPTVTPVVCHGALRTDQFLLRQTDQQTTAEAELLLIDLDTLCLADPACDLGNCLAYLYWKALRQPQYAYFIERASAAFLAGYLTLRRLPDLLSLAFYQALSLIKIAGRRFATLSYREWPLTPALVQSAATLLANLPTTKRMATIL
jgi:hypothetical protein